MAGGVYCLGLRAPTVEVTFNSIPVRGSTHRIPRGRHQAPCLSGLGVIAAERYLRRRSPHRLVINAISPRSDINRELLIGDCVAIITFCLYKEVASIVLDPQFEGWFAPLHPDPIRLAELVSFALTLVGSWVAACFLTEGYRTTCTRDLATTLVHVSRAWLVAMPVAAAQLVLTTAAESGVLVGDEGFASVLPLAASGPGEPFVTASQLLGLMTGWRAFYSVVLDFWNLKLNNDVARFKEGVLMVGVMAITSSAVITGLQLVASPDMLQDALDKAAAAMHL